MNAVLRALIKYSDINGISSTFGVLMCSILETPVQMMRRKLIRTDRGIGSFSGQKNRASRRMLIKRTSLDNRMASRYCNSSHGSGLSTEIHRALRLIHGGQHRTHRRTTNPTMAKAWLMNIKYVARRSDRRSTNDWLT